MTPGAAWEDVRVGLQYLRLFQRCAIVTDIGWVRESSRLAGTLLPCPVKVFKNAEWQEAIGWLASTPAASVAPHRILPDSDVLVIEPAGPLGIEDFDAIELTVDSWMEGQGRPLRGIVVHSRAFPGWESIGGFFRHLRFLHDHQSRIHRIGIAADGRLAEFGPKLGNHLLEAEIRHFGYDAFDEALAWAAAAEAPSKREHAASAG